MSEMTPYEFFARFPSDGLRYLLKEEAKTGVPLPEDCREAIVAILTDRGEAPDPAELLPIGECRHVDPPRPTRRRGTKFLRLLARLRMLWDDRRRNS